MARCVFMIARGVSLSLMSLSPTALGACVCAIHACAFVLQHTSDEDEDDVMRRDLCARRRKNTAAYPTLGDKKVRCGRKSYSRLGVASHPHMQALFHVQAHMRICAFAHTVSLYTDVLHVFGTACLSFESFLSPLAHFVIVSLT